jgi:nucleoid DNA-binding protein
VRNVLFLLPYKGNYFMVGKVIRDYIEGGAKKLTVPGFGTFMRRDEGGGNAHGGVIFVDLLRTDDGALREMVEDRGGFSEVEAMALIDRFIFETKNTIERTGNATIDGFGTMSLDQKGVYQFTYSPKARAVKENAVQERLFEKETPRPTSPRPARTTEANRPTPPTRPAVKHTDEWEDEPRKVRTPRSEKRRPERRSPQPAGARRKPQGKRSTTDTILIVAIAAAAIALIAMIFGMTAGNMPFLQR